jgi:putative sugar O-methyltransferase
LPIDKIEMSEFGSPADSFIINKKNYSIHFLNYYLRYCFVNKQIQLKGDEVIVELGSGSGHQVEILKKLYPGITVLCFDLPAQIFLAEKYLTNVLEQDSCVALENCMNWTNLDRLEKGKVHFFGNWQYDILTDFKFDIFWNAASFGEMEPEVVQNYLSGIDSNCRFIYLTQARNGKEVKGKNHVRNPISFLDYCSYLTNHELMAEQDLYQSNRKLNASGGYFEAVWKKKAS